MMKKSKAVLGVLVCFLSLLISFGAFAQENRARLGLVTGPLQASPLLLQHLRLSEGEGLMVMNIVVGGALEQSGLSQGDIVLAIDGHALSKPSDIQEYVSTLPKNAPVTLDVIQKGEHRQINMVLDSLPDEIVWKYAQPVSGFGRSSGLPFGGGLQLRQVQPSQQQGQIGSQKMMSKMMVTTPNGVQSSTVTIDGPRDDPNSMVEVQIGSDVYKTRVGEIDKLPDEARNAALKAISQGGNFSFSFGFGGGNDFMEEMMRRHLEQMRMMDELFNQQFMEPLEEEKKPDSVLKPVEPDDSHIRT